MEEEKISSYKEIFGMSKKELMKACAKYARYQVLAKLTKASYKGELKYQIRRVKLLYHINTYDTFPKWMDEDSRWYFLLNFKREKYYLELNCEEIMEFANKSYKEVKEQAMEILKSKDLPF